MGDLGTSEDEAFVDRVRSARLGGAVLKTRLIAFLRRVRPTLRYEPFPCGGKKEVRELKNALARDLAHLDDGVFFFVDRDFNDLLGFNSIDKMFVTDAYSVENYLVDEEVLEKLLRDEFPCHAQPQVRQQIVNIFRKDYSEFLRHTAPVNLRLYVARRLEIKLTKQLPKTLRQLVTVRIGNIGAVAVDPKEVVACEREPTSEEVGKLLDAFEGLDPKVRYRGKFAIKFFQEWVGKLAVEYLAGEAGAFGQRMPEGAIRRAEFVLSNFASKSRVPTGFAAFIDAI